jgi:hypothetical protein
VGIEAMSTKNWIHPQSQPIVDYTSAATIPDQQQINNYNQNAYMSPQWQQLQAQQAMQQNQYNGSISSGIASQLNGSMISSGIASQLNWQQPLNIVSDEEMKFVEELRKTKLMKLAKL